MSDMSDMSYKDVEDCLEGALPDAVVKANGVPFHVNKMVLCTCSKYFRALFIRNAAPDKKVFNIPGVSAEMMQRIIEYAYTGFVSVTEENVQELLTTANQFTVIGMEEVCSKFLIERLNSQNCIGFWKLTYFCFCPELREDAFHHILSNFEEVVSSEEFLELTPEELTHILARDDLNVKEETTAFEAVTNWMSYAPTERNKHFPELLLKVRLALADTGFIRDLKSYTDVKNNADCMDFVSKAELFHRHMDPLTIYSDPIARPRLPNTIIFAHGGWSGRHPTHVIEVYDIRGDCWRTLETEEQFTCAYHGTVYYNESIYCIGGFFESSSSSSMFRLDLTTGAWHESAPMHCRRCYVSVSLLNGYIYAIGGRDDRLRLNTAERYKPETNQWNYIASMHEARSDASCTTFNSMVSDVKEQLEIIMETIYVCGGFSGTQSLSSCEYYCPLTNVWTMFSSMIDSRSGLGLMAYANQIFAVGGFDGATRLNKVEAYNPQTSTWRQVSDMSKNRSNFGIALLENKLFVVGGFNVLSTINDVEYYDVLTDEWHEARPMAVLRSALSCCVVTKPPNIERYTVCRDTMPQIPMEDCTLDALPPE